MTDTDTGIRSMGDNLIANPPTRQVAREFLFTQAQEFLRADPNQNHLPRSQRRLIARDIANRTRRSMVIEQKVSLG